MKWETDATAFLTSNNLSCTGSRFSTSLSCPCCEISHHQTLGHGQVHTEQRRHEMATSDAVSRRAVAGDGLESTCRVEASTDFTTLLTGLTRRCGAVLICRYLA